MPEKSWFEILVNAPWMGAVLGAAIGSAITGMISYITVLKNNKKDIEKIKIECEHKEKMWSKEKIFEEKKKSYLQFTKFDISKIPSNDLFYKTLQCLSPVQLFGSDGVNEARKKFVIELGLMVTKIEEKKSGSYRVEEYSKSYEALLCAMEDDLKKYS